MSFSPSKSQPFSAPELTLSLASFHITFESVITELFGTLQEREIEVAVAFTTGRLGSEAVNVKYISMHL